MSYACISAVCAVEPRRRFVVTKRKKKKKRKRKPKFQPRLLCLGNYFKSTQWLFGFSLKIYSEIDREESISDKNCFHETQICISCTTRNVG